MRCSHPFIQSTFLTAKKKTLAWLPSLFKSSKPSLSRQPAPKRLSVSITSSLKPHRAYNSADNVAFIAFSNSAKPRVLLTQVHGYRFKLRHHLTSMGAFSVICQQLTSIHPTTENVTLHTHMRFRLGILSRMGRSPCLPFIESDSGFCFSAIPIPISRRVPIP